jgi:phenylalanyl-tRNA synthetase beta chain
MPNITLIRDHLFQAIGKHYTEHEFDELCFEFGVEVDDVATEVIEVSTASSLLLCILYHEWFLVYWQ